MKKYLVGFAIIGLLAISILGYNRLSRPDQIEVDPSWGSPLAKLKETSNIVKYRHPGDIFFNETQQNMDFFNQSELNTSESSVATIIALDSALKINIPQNTLIKFSPSKKDKSGIGINLVTGGFALSTTEKGGAIELNSAGKTIRIEAQPNSKINLNKSQVSSEKMEIQAKVEAGKITVESENSKETMSPGEVLKINQSVNSSDTTIDFSIQKESSIKLKPLLPNNFHKWIANSQYEFAWEAEKPFGISIEIATDPKFEKTKITKEMPPVNAFKISNDGLTPGKYYWRLKQVMNNDVNFSDSNTFEVVNVTAPILLQPNRSFVRRGQWKVNVEVKDSTPLNKYQFEVAKDSEFKEIFDEVRSTSPLTTHIDIDGDFYIRAKQVFDGEVTSDWSNIVSNRVRPPLKTPTSKIDYEVFNEKTTSSTLKIQWAPVQDTDYYTIQMSETSDFKNIVKTQTTKDTTITINHQNSSPGYMRVLANSNEGEVSPSNSIFEYKGIMAPAKFESFKVYPKELDSPNSTAKLQLIWKHVEKSTGYIVEIANNEKMIDSLNFETPNIEIIHPIDSFDQYYFRVTPKADPSLYFTYKGEISSVEHKKLGALQTSKKFSPKNNEIFMIPQGVAPSIKFTWQEIPEATWYILELSKTESFTSPKTFKSDTNIYILKERLPTGKWYFRIKARNPYQQSDWSEVGVFYFGT